MDDAHTLVARDGRVIEVAVEDRDRLFGPRAAQVELERDLVRATRHARSPCTTLFRSRSQAFRPPRFLKIQAAGAAGAPSDSGPTFRRGSLASVEMAASGRTEMPAR